MLMSYEKILHTLSTSGAGDPLGFLSESERLGLDIFDPNSRQKEDPKPPLNGLWGKAAVAFLEIQKDCSYFDEVSCGSSVIKPSKRFRNLFGINEKNKTYELTVAVALGLGDDKNSRTAHVVLSMNNIIIDFDIRSINERGSKERLVVQRKIQDGNVDLLEAESSKSPAWRNYLETLRVIESIDNWQNSKICNNCLVKGQNIR